MQNQGVIALAPIVADARFAVDDQRIDAQLGEARSGRKPGLASTDNQRGRIVVSVLSGSPSEIEPIRPAKVA
jgi:hypothetical protein